MTVDKAIQHLKNMTWLDGFKNTTVNGKPLNSIILDIIDLLKEQTPRVMTLEEVLGGDECWIETTNDICGYGDAVLIRDGEFVDFYRPRNINTFDFYEYGLSWRCWTFRPTDEQRKVTPWETGTTNGKK